MPKSQPRRAAPAARVQAQERRSLPPRVVVAVFAALTAAVVVLAVLLALGVNGEKAGQSLAVTTCQAGTPGCELRSPTHLHANFAVVIRGEKFDFNQDEFLSVENNDRSPLAHLHVPRFSVAHIHRTGTSWDEFFRSIGFQLSDPSVSGTSPEKSCLKLPDGENLCASASESFKFFVNGTRVDGVAFTNMSDLDKVLISFGSESADVVARDQLGLVGDDACIPSERCVERIPVDEPDEPCTRSNDTCVKPGG